MRRQARTTARRAGARRRAVSVANAERLRAPRRSALIAALVALAALPGGTALADGWVLPSTPLAPLATGVTDQAVAIGAAGDVAAVWSDGASVLAATRPAGGSWSTPLPLGTTTAVQSPSVGVDGHGDATLVWASSDDGVSFTTQTARWDASAGTWSAPQSLASTGDTVPPVQVRVNAAGEAVAAWVAQDPVSSNDVVWGAAASGGGAWGTPVALSDPADSAIDGGRPQVALAADGDALVAWTALGADAQYHVRQRLLTGGAWDAGGDADIATSADPLTPVELDGDASGAAVAAWFDQGSPLTLQASARSAGAWSAPADLSTDVAPACTPPVAAGEAQDGSGDATVMWHAGSSEGFAARRLVSGLWGSAADVYTPGATETVQGLALGGADAVFTVSDFVSNVYRVLAERPSGSGWSAPATLASAGGGNSLSPIPSVAVNAGGDALAGWTDIDASGDAAVDTAGFQATAPTLTSVAVPAAGTAGAALTASTAARSVFAVLGQPVWDFGDGTPAASGASVDHVYAHAGDYTVTVTVTDSAGNHVSTTRQVAVTAAPGPPPGPTSSGPGPTPASAPTPPSPRPPALKVPVLGAQRGLLLLAHGSRTVTLVLRNRDRLTLSGLATLTTVAARHRPAVTLASRRGISVRGGKRVTLKLRLSDDALQRLRSAAKHAFPVRLSVRLRAPDHRLVTVAGTYTLDGSALYAPLPPRTLSHGIRRRMLARIAC